MADAPHSKCGGKPWGFESPLRHPESILHLVGSAGVRVLGGITEECHALAHYLRLTKR